MIIPNTPDRPDGWEDSDRPVVCIFPGQLGCAKAGAKHPFMFHWFMKLTVVRSLTEKYHEMKAAKPLPSGTYIVDPCSKCPKESPDGSEDPCLNCLFNGREKEPGTYGADTVEDDIEPIPPTMFDCMCLEDDCPKCHPPTPEADKAGKWHNLTHDVVKVRNTWHDLADDCRWLHPNAEHCCHCEHPATGMRSGARCRFIHCPLMQG